MNRTFKLFGHVVTVEKAPQYMSSGTRIGVEFAVKNGYTPERVREMAALQVKAGNHSTARYFEGVADAMTKGGGK